jgi:hypothetical protein
LERTPYKYAAYSISDQAIFFIKQNLNKFFKLSFGTTQFTRRLKAIFMRNMTTTFVTMRAANDETLIQIAFPLFRGCNYNNIIKI